MTAVTNESVTITAHATGGRRRTKARTSAAAATMRAKSPGRSVNQAKRTRPARSPSFSGQRAASTCPAPRPAPRPTLRRHPRPSTCARITSLNTTPTPAPIMSPMPRLDTMPCAADTFQSPSAVPPVTIPSQPTTAPNAHHAIERRPARNPTARRIGEFWMPSATPGSADDEISAGIRPKRSRATLHRPASAMDAKSRRPVSPPARLAIRVSAAAVPMGYGRSDCSIKRRRITEVHTSPKSVPASATASISPQLTSSARPKIQTPGMVKARPPATIEPADMMTWVIFASLRLVFPTARNSTSAVMEVKIVGQGRDPILRAV